ncbi:hypothetical protein [Comamonas testosteroni]|uniref:hypothetical protein n=1 Tax=Comamonas testosteroni TaxID=285 RepID=UPI0015FCD419|nr:hypothetical protein [Comamonas testosteroni]
MKLNLPAPAAALVGQLNKVEKQNPLAYWCGQFDGEVALLAIVGKNLGRVEI